MARPRKRGRPAKKTAANKKAKTTSAEEECASASVEEENVDATMGASSTIEEKEELPVELPVVETPAVGAEGEGEGDNNTTNTTEEEERVLNVGNTDLSQNIIPSDEFFDPNDPGEEFVFAPIIDPEQLEVTPTSSRHCTSTTGETESSNSSATVKIKDSEVSSSSGGECSHNVLIEVIDVDDLPDTPTPLSSIGDDVIEITPDNSDRGESPEIVLDRQVVDLTGTCDCDSRHPHVSSVSSVSDDSDIDDIDHDALLSMWSRMSKKKKSNSASASASSGACKSNEGSEKSQPDKPDSESSSSNKLNCPICMDDFSMIVKDRQLMSTSCGHVFCSVCIKAAVETQKKCPTCRKKQLAKNLHPIFL